MAAGDITQDMVAVVRHRLGDPGGTQWSEAELLSYLNEAQRQLADDLCDGALHELTFVQSITLETAVAAYSLNSNFLRVRRVVYKADDAILWPIADIRALRENAHHEGSETVPYYVVWDGKTIEFFVGTGGVTQTNGDVALVYYIKSPTDMSLSVDMELGSQYRNIVEQRAYATALSAAPEGDTQTAEIEMQMYDFLVEVINSHWSDVEAFGGIPNDPIPARQSQR